MALSAPELLTARHDVTGFSCGQPALGHWLRTRALANQAKGFTVVMVVHDALRVVGLQRRFHRRDPGCIVTHVEVERRT